MALNKEKVKRKKEKVVSGIGLSRFVITLPG